MKDWRKIAIVTVGVLVFGAARLPFEAGLHRDLTSAGLLSNPIEISTRDRIGQTSSAVALGGLRTLVATFLNLRAFSAFTEKDWVEVEENFELIVDLAPRTRYYWETGAWHMAYNAASYYLNDSDKPPLRRRESWRSYIQKGRSFLERGIKNNPNDWSIAANLGFLLSDTNKFMAFRDPDATFAAAADAYGQSVATGFARAYVKRAQFYALARVRGREAEALEMARSLYAEGRGNHTPTLKAMLVVLEAHENPEMDVTARAIEIFGSPEKAYEVLSGHWFRTRERFPVYGVARALRSLEEMLRIPADQSVFNKPLLTPRDLDEMFRQ